MDKSSNSLVIDATFAILDVTEDSNNRKPEMLEQAAEKLRKEIGNHAVPEALSQLDVSEQESQYTVTYPESTPGHALATSKETGVRNIVPIGSRFDTPLFKN